MFKSYFLAKFIKKMHIPSFDNCNIDSTAKAASGSSLARVTMGRYSYVGCYTRITDAEIGSFCSIGDNCEIGGGIHPMDTVSTSPVFLQGKNILKKNFSHIPFEPSKTVQIGHDVWIGDGVFIKAGVKVGNGSVIGAHAVVVHDVEPYSIVAGVPAMIIRKRFDDSTIHDLLELKWWDFSDEEINKHADAFANPNDLIKTLNSNKE